MLTIVLSLLVPLALVAFTADQLPGLPPLAVLSLLIRTSIFAVLPGHPGQSCRFCLLYQDG